eukprot:SAG31_NODE_7547_length_1658_cov_2.223861_1_plen_260_part_00
MEQANAIVDTYISLLRSANLVLANADSVQAPGERLRQRRLCYEMFLEAVSERVHGAGDFTSICIPVLAVHAGLVPVRSGWAAFATCGSVARGSTKMLEMVGLTPSALTALAETAGVTEAIYENFLCELYRELSPGSSPKFDFYDPNVRILKLATDGQRMELVRRPEVLPDGKQRLDNRVVPTLKHVDPKMLATFKASAIEDLRSLWAAKADSKKSPTKSPVKATKKRNWEDFVRGQRREAADAQADAEAQAALSSAANQ